MRTKVLQRSGFSPNRPSGFRAVSIYSAVSAIMTSVFFLFHYVGNQVPDDLAKQRFAEEFVSNEGLTGGFARGFGYCQISTSVMAGARHSKEADCLAEAIILENFVDGSKAGNYCAPLQEAVGGVEIQERALKDPLLVRRQDDLRYRVALPVR